MGTDTGATAITAAAPAQAVELHLMLSAVPVGARQVARGERNAGPGPLDAPDLEFIHRGIKADRQRLWRFTAGGRAAVFHPHQGRMGLVELDLAAEQRQRLPFHPDVQSFDLEPALLPHQPLHPQARAQRSLRTFRPERLRACDLAQHPVQRAVGAGPPPDAGARQQQPRGEPGHEQAQRLEGSPHRSPFKMSRPGSGAAAASWA